MKISNIKYQISNKYQLGFTLIELIVVIGIIAVLSAMLIAVIDPFTQFQKARDAQRKSDLGQIQKELEQYYQDTGHYPSPSGYQIVGINGGIVAFGSTNSNNWPYATTLPQDPNYPSRSYVYYANGQTYWLYASLERGSNDPQVCNKGNTCANVIANNVPMTACGSTILCNYGVSSPNTTP